VKTMRQRVMLAVAVGVGSVGLFGAAALGAFGAGTSSSLVSAVAPAASSLMGEDKAGDRLKHLLDGLVQKGVITQQQEDAIIEAAKDATTAKVRTAKVVRDLLGESASYLGVTHKDLVAKLPGTSLGKIADATPNKSRAGLVAALTTAANADIDKALADKKITDDQAKKLRDGLAAEITKFVDRTWPTKPAGAPRAVGPNVKAFPRRHAPDRAGLPRRRDAHGPHDGDAERQEPRGHRERHGQESRRSRAGAHDSRKHTDR